MQTSQPFRFFSPSSYIKKRYSPILATYVEPTVDEFLKQSGFSFSDIFASVGSKLKSPVRIYPHDKIRQQNFNEFIIQITKDLKSVGSAFLAKSYEETYTYDTTVGPFPNLLQQNLSPNSPETGYPAWYRIFLYRIFESLLFSDFEFHDIPIGILYVVSFGQTSKSVSEIRQVVNDFPEWMKEYSREIPVVCLVVGNNLQNPVIPDKLKEYRNNGFTYTTSINLCTNGKKLTPEDAKEYFGWDYHILTDPNFGNNFSKNDIISINKLFLDLIQNFVTPEIYKQQKFWESESDKLNKFSKTIQTWFFKKGEPEKVTEYMNIPVKKVSYLQHAGYSMLFGSYQLAQRSYRYFLNSMNRDEQALIQNRVQVSVILCDMILNDDMNDTSQFNGDVIDLVRNRPSVVCMRGMLIAPLLAFEFSVHVKGWTDAFEFGQITIDLIEDLYGDMEDVKDELLGVMFERIAGLESREKHQITLRAMAAFYYRSAKQNGHALRCFLWLLSQLPKDVWNRLWQTIALEKVIILSEQNQINRSLHDIAFLMSVTTMSDDLQNLLLTQFLSIFNDRNADIKSLSIELKPLLFVKKVKMFDPSQPEFYGYSKYDFKKILEKFKLWFSANVSRSSSVSFEELWNNGEASEEEMAIVPTGVDVRVEISLINRHAFTIQLTDSMLDVSYVSSNKKIDEDEEEEAADDGANFTLSKVEHIDIHGSKTGNSSTKFALKITPSSQGKYTVKRLVNSYWGYIDSFVGFKPISFVALHEYPRVRTQVVDLPRHAAAHQCIPFFLSVDNLGQCSLVQMRVLCDPFIVYERGETDFNKHVQIVTIEKTIEPMQSELIPFIYHVPESKGGRDTIHFVIDVQGVKCSFQKVEVEIEKKTVVSVEKLSMKNETLSRILKCKFRSHDGRFVSIFKKDGSLLKTLYNDTHSKSQTPLTTQTKSNPSLDLFGNLNISTANSSSSLRLQQETNTVKAPTCDMKSSTIFAYLDKCEDRIEEEWRCRLLKRDELGVLFQIGGCEYLAQANVKIPRFDEEEVVGEGADGDGDGEGFRNFSMRVFAEERRCVVSVANYRGPVMYVEPLPIEMEMQLNTPINCCAWVGKRRQRVGRGIDAVFRFAPNVEGVAKIYGFRVSAKSDFSNPKLLNLTQTFRLCKE